MLAYNSSAAQRQQAQQQQQAIRNNMAQAADSPLYRNTVDSPRSPSVGADRMQYDMYDSTKPFVSTSWASQYLYVYSSGDSSTMWKYYGSKLASECSWACSAFADVGRFEIRVGFNIKISKKQEDRPLVRNVSMLRSTRYTEVQNLCPADFAQNCSEASLRHDKTTIILTFFCYIVRQDACRLYDTL